MCGVFFKIFFSEYNIKVVLIIFEKCSWHLEEIRQCVIKQLVIKQESPLKYNRFLKHYFLGNPIWNVDDKNSNKFHSTESQLYSLKLVDAKTIKCWFIHDRMNRVVLRASGKSFLIVSLTCLKPRTTLTRWVKHDHSVSSLKCSEWFESPVQKASVALKRL